MHRLRKAVHMRTTNKRKIEPVSLAYAQDLLENTAIYVIDVTMFLATLELEEVLED